MLTMALLWAPSGLAAEPACNADDVTDELTAAIESFQERDADALRSHFERAVSTVGCLPEPLPAATAARLHAVGALVVFVDNDREDRESSTLAQLRASERLDSDSDWLDSLQLPAGHRLYEWSEHAQKATSSFEPLPKDALGELFVDGTRSSKAPSQEPYVLQQRVGGSIVAGGYVPWHEDVSLELGPVRERKGLLVAGVTSCVLAAASFGASVFFQEQANENEAQLTAEQQDSYTRAVNANHASFIGGLAFSTIGTTLLTVQIVR